MAQSVQDSQCHFCEISALFFSTGALFIYATGCKSFIASLPQTVEAKLIEKVP